MEELEFNYAKGNRVTNIIVFSLFAVYTAYSCIQHALIKNFGVLFFIPLALFLIAVFFILRNTIWLPAPVLKINNEFIISHSPHNKNFTVDWVNVSSVNIGPGYIIFMLSGGQKQKKLELLSLRYGDLLEAKSKVIEICEHKNIPYHND
jgi:hypothetical protein